ncbi:MAG: MFS transporter [Acidimicrobiales bacterium]|nr:MFS transporter [Acidimicrobiales bacterium]
MKGREIRPDAARHGVFVLGIVTITSYGSWLYSFGVLIGPIHDDAGWGTTALGVAYGAGFLLNGPASLLGGRLLDRHGCRGPFLLQAVVGGGFLLAASWAGHPVVFGVLYALGAGTVGATGFYHVTTAAAARLRPDRPDRAIARLTIIGALCSAIYLPATAWLVEAWGWRNAARVLALTCIAGALLGATLGTTGRGEVAASRSPWGAMGEALRRPAVRRMLLVFFLAWMAYTAILGYQVPIMTSAGLALGTAGVLGGLRGFGQLLGRVGLTGIVERFGAGPLLRLSYLGSAVGVAFLLVGTVPAGIAYAVLAGASLGATSPLQAIYARTRFAARDLGLLMGLQGLAAGVAGAVGPVLGGLSHDLLDSWTPTVGLGVAALVASAVLLHDRPKTP